MRHTNSTKRAMIFAAMIAVLATPVAPAAAATVGTATIVVDVQGTATSSTYCLQATPANATYDVFGTSVNMGTQVGTMVCSGTTTNGVSSGSCASYPDAGLLSYNTSGINVCNPAGCLGNVALVSETMTNVTGSVAATIGDVVSVSDTYEAFDSYALGSSIPNCPLSPSQYSAHYTGTVATNAFQKLSTVTGSNVTVTSATTVFNPLTVSEAPLAADVTFAQVGSAGDTVVSASSNTAVPLPANFAADVGGYKALFIDVTTTATVSGPITVCSSYTDANDDGFLDGTTVREADLSLMRSEGASPVFVDRTSSRDSVNNTICAEVTGLSTFVVAVRTNGTCAPADEGNPCNDGNACTSNDTCASGVCTGGATSCNDSNPCTDDVCIGITGCVSTPNTASCDDGFFCNGTDTCSGGACGHTGDPCAGGTECNDICNEAADNCFNSTSSICTDDGNGCTDDQCNGAGTCVHPNNTAPCDDGIACTGSGTCGAGSCQPGTPILICGDNMVCGTETCDDGNAVNGDGCDNNCTVSSALGQWVTKAPIPTARHSAAVVVDAAGRIHVIGGVTCRKCGQWDSEHFQVDAHDVYDPVARSWSNAAPLLDHVSGAGVALRGNGLIYVFGGTTGGSGGRTSAVYVYDVGSNTWMAAPSMPFAGWAPGGDFGTDDRLYVFGGELAESRLQIFDPALNAWTTGPASPGLPAPRKGHGAFRGFDGRFYVFGGCGNDCGQDTTFIYDPGTSTWSAGPSLPAGVNSFGAAFTPDRQSFFVLGGSDNQGGTSPPFFDAVYLFDVLAQTWSTLSPLPTARKYLGAAYSAGALHSFGGVDETALPGNHEPEPYHEQMVFPILCGNSTLDPDETCDDGNFINADGCDASCTVTACGNGVRTQSTGELCDDGNLTDADGCDSNCTVTGCGNGDRTQSTGEACDDGNLVNGDGCEMTCTITPVSQMAAAGGTVTTDPTSSGATPEIPVQTSITTPNAGTVSISSASPGASPGGLEVVGQQLEITAPAATANAPLVLVLTIDASALPMGVDPVQVEVMRNSAVVGACTGAPGVAEPDPCLQSRAVVAGGDVELTVLTSHASLWALALRGLLPAERTCVNGMNAAGVRVAKAQRGVNTACLKGGAKGTVADAQACLNDDPTGKLTGPLAKTDAFAAKKCTVAPLFGFTSPSTVNTNARQQAFDLMADLFGSNLTASVIPKSNIAGSTCQTTVLAATQNLLNVTMAQFLKCKRTGLTGKPRLILSTQRLTECFDTLASDANGKITKAVAKLATKVAACSGVTLSSAFPGACATAGNVPDCVQDRVACRICQMFNAMDGLSKDCDEFDDRVVNGSCP